MQTILHTIETAGPGGAETVLYNLATALDPQRFRSVAVLPEEYWLGKKLTEAGIRTYYITSQGWYDFRILGSLARIAAKEKVDLIHSHLPGYNFYSCVAARLVGRRVAVTYHGPVELSDSQSLRGAIKLRTVRSSADAVVVVCGFMAEMLKKRGFCAAQLRHIPNGIPTSRFKEVKPGKLRRELGVATDVRIVGTVANVRGSKGYEHFLKAAQMVLRRFPNTLFVAAGDIDPVLGTPLLKLHQSLGLGERFRFLGFRDDVAAILCDLDVFVLASTSEGLPLVTLEAMASGKALVVTKCGGPQEVVDHGVSGFVVQPADPEALANAIEAILQKPEMADRFGDYGRRKVEAQFSIDAMVAQYESLYTKLLEHD